MIQSDTMFYEDQPTKALELLIKGVRSKASEWNISIPGFFSINHTNSHGRKIDSINNHVFWGLLVSVGYAALSKQPVVAVIALCVWIVSVVVNFFLVIFRESLFGQEEAVIIARIADKLTDATEPGGKRLQAIIQDELVQPKALKIVNKRGKGRQRI